jgi:putative endonuclease
LNSELRVREYYEKKQYQFLSHRLKTPYGEVDLLFWTSRGHLLMVEVKSSSHHDFQSYRIGWKQKKRLERALIFLSEKFETPVEIHWAFVDSRGEVFIVEDVVG